MAQSLFTLYAAEVCPDELKTFEAAQKHVLQLVARAAAGDQAITAPDVEAALVAAKALEAKAQACFDDRWPRWSAANR